MPSPVSPNTLKDLIPTRNGSFCGRFIPGIINWMQARADYWRWKYKDDGNFTVSFLTDLCIAVNGTGTGGGGNTSCPPVALSSKVIYRSGLLKLTFTGVGMTAGYTWNLYRRTPDTGTWGSAITSGTTTSDTITYDDSGLTNETKYFYKLTVQLPGCPVQTLYTNGTPHLCLGFDFQINGYAEGDGAITINCSNLDADYPMDGSFEFAILVAGVEQTIVSPTVGDHPCTLNGMVGMCITIGGLNAGQQVVTVKIRENSNCSYVSHDITLTIVGALPPTPVIRWNSALGRIEVLAPVPAHYTLFRLALGNCVPPDNTFVEINGYSGQFIQVQGSLGAWPCTDIGVIAGAGTTRPTYGGRQKYVVYIAAEGSNGQRSLNSNPVTTSPIAQQNNVPACAY